MSLSHDATFHPVDGDVSASRNKALRLFQERKQIANSLFSLTKTLAQKNFVVGYEGFRSSVIFILCVFLFAAHFFAPLKWNPNEKFREVLF